jgi:hypothetical protein
MSEIKTLYDIYQNKSSSFIEKLLNNKVIIDDNIQGSYFSAKISDKGWLFFKKNEQISLIDRLVSKFYEIAISHFMNISHDKMNNIPHNLIFIMKYIPNSNNIDQITSKQILKLTHIIDANTNLIINDIEVLKYWADFLVIGNPPIIFDGTLNDAQKTEILNFIYTNQDDLAKRFKSESFTEYIISLLNPNYTSNGIDSIVFRFTDEDTDETILAKFIDPLFYDLSKSNPKNNKTNQSSDMFYLIVIQLLNFIESYTIKDLIDIVDPNLSYDQNYIRIMNRIYVDYIEQNYSDITDIQILPPDYMQELNQGLNLALIDDIKVIDLIQLNNNYMEVYRILVNFFKKKRKHNSNMFSQNIANSFNLLIDKLQKIVLGKNVYESYTPTYNEFTSQLSENFNLNMVRKNGIQYEFASHNKRIPVNIIVDYFQPVNNTHLSTAETLFKKNKLKTLFIIIKSAEISPTKPFNFETTKDLMVKFMSESHEYIESFVIIEKNTIDSILKSICEKYIPVLWASNKSKINEYVIQLEYARKRNTKYNVSKKFKLIVSPELDNTRILDYIKTGNFEQYKQYIPKCLHSEFFKLKQQIDRLPD